VLYLLYVSYYTNFSISNINSSYRTAHMQDLDALYVQLQTGTLPSVVWTSFSESYDMAISDSNIYDASTYLQYLMNAIQSSSYWQQNKVLVSITWSDNGALYDHVPPYAGDRFGPGPRVPTILVSPAHAGLGINSQPYEHLSLMKMIETRFHLNSTLISPARTQSIRDMTNSFDDPTSAAPTRLGWGLTNLGAVSVSGAASPLPLYVRNETFTVTPANINVPVTPAAVSALSQFKNFIIIQKSDMQQQHSTLQYNTIHYTRPD
jgi:phospholipase C